MRHASCVQSVRHSVRRGVLSGTNLEKKNNIILYFNSKGCGPCKQAKPIVKKIVESRKAHFYSDVVEGDTHSQALEQFCKVEFYPTLVIIENNEINRYVGLNQIKTL